MDTLRALLFGVVKVQGGKVGGDSVAHWDSPRDAVGGIIRVLASDLDNETTVTTFTFPSRQVNTRRVEPDPAARKQRLSAEEEAQRQAAQAAARADHERRAAAIQNARRSAHEAAIQQAQHQVQQAKEFAERLSESDPVSAEDLLAAFAAVGDGPSYLDQWGRAIIEAVEGFTRTDAVDPMNGTLFTVLKDAAEKRYQTLTPFQWMLEAPLEIGEIAQAHADGLTKLIAARDDVLSGVLSELARRLIESLDNLRWGELARFGAVREQPPRPVDFDEDDV